MKLLKIIKVFAIITFLIFFFMNIPWIILYLGLVGSAGPLSPKITYGEFPFTLEYEIDGERFVIEDTVICEFDGIGMNEGVGKYRKWKSHLASNGAESLLLLIIDDTRKIYCSIGDAKYYMDDEEEYVTRKIFIPKTLFEEIDGNITHISLIKPEELIEKYKIKIISWELSDPIENEFGSKFASK